MSFGLLKEAKKLKRIGVSFVWVANGSILIREKTGSAVIKITSMSQLNKIEHDIRLNANTPATTQSNSTSTRNASTNGSVRGRQQQMRNTNANRNNIDASDAPHTNTKKKHLVRIRNVTTASSDGSVESEYADTEM